MKNDAGFTFIDVIVGTALLLIVFSGIFGAFQLGLRVIGISKAKVTATALANQKLEEARNLPYQKVGIQGIDENGALLGIEYYLAETKEYTIFTDVDCRNNLADGVDDVCLCDYKTVTTTVSWTGRFSGEISLSTDIAPKNDIQECEEKGGVLELNVFDAQGIGVVDAQVQVEDIDTGFIEQCFTDLNGECTGERGIFLDISLEPENYKVTVSKTGYSKEETFKSGDSYDSQIIANPEKPNVTILEGQIIERSFSIDKVSTFSVETKSSRGKKSFDDEFANMGKISDYSSISVSGGEVTLAKTNGDYASSGFLISTDITSPNLQGWNQFSWVETTPAGTEIKYQLLYFDDTDWVLIPDTDLPGNSIGLSPSPVELSQLDYSLYGTLRAKATLSTTDLSQSPRLFEWHLIYFTRVARPISGVTFYLRGEKIVGKDSNENPIYKYPLLEHSIDRSGDISGLEWDTYNLSNFAIEGVSINLEEGIPGQILVDGSLSVNLSPNTNQSLILYLAAADTLLVSVKDSETLEPIFSASVRVYNADFGYDKTQQTDENGETFFVPLQEAFYNLEVIAQGYETYTGENFWISGDVISTINLILSPS